MAIPIQPANPAASPFGEPYLDTTPTPVKLFLKEKSGFSQIVSSGHKNVNDARWITHSLFNRAHFRLETMRLLEPDERNGLGKI